MRNPNRSVTASEASVSKASVVLADQEEKNSFCSRIRAADTIMLHTKARALKRHQCQRIVAGARIIVTTTKIMVSQADTIFSKERLNTNAIMIITTEASWPNRTSRAWLTFLRTYRFRKSLVMMELVTLIIELSVDMRAASSTAMNIPWSPTGSRISTSGMIFSASNFASEP